MNDQNGKKDKRWTARAGSNLLLESISEEDRKRLETGLEKVHLKMKQVLYEANQLIDYVYFPLEGVASIIVVMDDGSIVEVGTIGNEGMIGVPLLLAVDNAPLKTFYQVPGDALRMKADVFRELVQVGSPIHSVLQRYTQALMSQIAQSTACNRIHPVEERCARWILMTHDRVAGDEFPLTYEFLAQMLGVRRPKVVVVAGTLQEAGLISYSRGRITILDRARLEQASCECYSMIRDEYARLLH